MCVLVCALLRVLRDPVPELELLLCWLTLGRASRAGERDFPGV